MHRSECQALVLGTPNPLLTEGIVELTPSLKRRRGFY